MTIFKTVILSLLAPLAIFIGVVLLKNVIATFFLFHIIVCLLIPLFDLVVTRSMSIKTAAGYLGLKSLKRGLLPGISLGAIFSASILLFFAIFNRYIMDAGQIRRLLAVWKVDALNIVVFLFFMIIANSVLEEVYWRGYIFSRLKGTVTVGMIILFTALFYCSYHFITTLFIFPFIYSLLLTLIVFLAGLVWGYLRSKNDSLAAPVISHLMADLSIMLVYIIYIRQS